MNTEINKNNIPQHIAVIMDGNGRWAKQQAKERIFGHQNAITAVRDTVETAAELGVKYLTLYAFSTENWNRPQAEVDGLMQLLVKCIHEETPTLQKTKNTGTTLILALSYSSRWEIKEALKKVVSDAKNGKIAEDEITETTLQNYLNTKNYPDPDLLIRTGGEHRISNFLLWQIAYTELYFTQKLWPDFRKTDLVEAIADYQGRQRRFGKTGDQVIENNNNQ